ncbi:MAG: hypothetical protein HY726_23160 [Candidatus Rokubacteria bacterium]|nr:hypothetical protein [Candidatus Rokubacteria bacterium]
MNRRQESLVRTNREIAREKAEALGRAGERIERLLRELDALAAELQRLEASGSRDRVADAERRYEALRVQALTARRYLMIQREAVGVRSHAVVSELFVVPPPRSRAGAEPRWAERQRSTG